MEYYQNYGNFQVLVEHSSRNRRPKKVEENLPENERAFSISRRSNKEFQKFVNERILKRIIVF